MPQPSNPDRAISLQAMLFMVFGVGLLMTVLALWFKDTGKASGFDRAQIASDALMHSQRIGKAAPGAAQGDQQAFVELEESRAQLKRDLGLMVGAGTAPAPANMDQALARLKVKAESMDQAAATILALKPELAGLEKTREQLDALTPELLAMSDELLMRKVLANGSPREIASLSRMTMLTQRMSLNANQFVSPDGIRPESAFQLGRDATQFGATIDGFLDGSEAMHLTAEQNPELRALLGKMKTGFGTYRQLLASLMGNLPKFTAAKGAALSILYDSEELKTQLTAMQSGLRAQQNSTGVRLWLIVAAGLLSASVAVTILVITPQDARPQVRALVPLRVLCLVAGLVILLAVFALAFSPAIKTGSSQQARIASDALMHSQRIGKAAPNAIQGNVDAFAQLEQSRQLLGRDLNLLAKGGTLDGASIPPPSLATARMLAPAMDKWRSSDNAASTILRVKPELTGYAKARSRFETLSPELLSMTEELLFRRVQKGASAREVANIGRLAMLTQRLSASAAKLLTSENVSPETAFILGRDANTFRSTLDGLLNGQAAMQLTAVSDPEARVLIGEIESKFNTYHQLVASTMDNLPKFTAAKGAEAGIRYENEALWKLLTGVQSGFSERQEPVAIWFWIVAFFALLTAVAAAALGMIMLGGVHARAKNPEANAPAKPFLSKNFADNATRPGEKRGSGTF